MRDRTTWRGRLGRVRGRAGVSGQAGASGDASGSRSTARAGARAGSVSCARRRRLHRLHRGDAGADGVEERAAIGHGRVAVDRQLARVDEGAVPGHREVQVRAGRQPGRADEADDVLLPDLLAGAQPARELRQVVVARRRARSRARSRRCCPSRASSRPRRRARSPTPRPASRPAPRSRSPGARARRAGSGGSACGRTSS